MHSTFFISRWVTRLKCTPSCSNNIFSIRNFYLQHQFYQFLLKLLRTPMISEIQLNHYLKQTIIHKKYTWLPDLFHILKDLVEIRLPSYCVSPCSTHAKAGATSLFCLQIQRRSGSIIMSKAIARKWTDHFYILFPFQVKNLSAQPRKLCLDLVNINKNFESLATSSVRIADTCMTE